MQYRRIQISGGTFFFTLVTYQRKPIFQDPKNIDLLRKIIKEVKSNHPFKIDAYSILPDHIHMVWTLPLIDKDFSTRWRLIKSNFTRRCLLKYKNLQTMARINKAEQCVWQRRFWEHQIRDDRDLQKHIEYIHYNPVKHGYVKSPKDWVHSSFKYYIESGMYDENWGNGEVVRFENNVGRE